MNGPLSEARREFERAVARRDDARLRIAEMWLDSVWHTVEERVFEPLERESRRYETALSDLDGTLAAAMRSIV